MEVEQWKKDEDDAFHMLKWIGKSVSFWLATLKPTPFKDKEASRFKANEAKANKAKIKEEKRKEEERKKKEEEGKARDYQVGRHMPQKVMQISGVRSGWRCRICRCMSSTKAKLDEKTCKGAVAKK